MNSYKQLLLVVPKVCAIQTQGTRSIIFSPKNEKYYGIFMIIYIAFSNISLTSKICILARYWWEQNLSLLILCFELSTFKFCFSSTFYMIPGQGIMGQVTVQMRAPYLCVTMIFHGAGRRIIPINHPYTCTGRII